MHFLQTQTEKIGVAIYIEDKLNPRECAEEINNNFELCVFCEFEGANNEKYSPNRSREGTAEINCVSVCLSVCLSVRHHLNAYISGTNKDTTMKLGRYVGKLVRLIVLKFHEVRKSCYVTMT